jgi:hypothetical protein
LSDPALIVIGLIFSAAIAATLTLADLSGSRRQEQRWFDG